MSDTTYTLGPPVRPDIHHDNGFLDKYKRRPPTIADRLLLAKWKTMLEGGEAVQGVPLAPHNHLSDALAAYRHFLYGKGQDRTINYERYVANDPSGKSLLDYAILDARTGAEILYDSNFKGTSARFQMTGTAMSVGGSDIRFPYPATENWQKALGGHDIWISAEVNVLAGKSGLEFTMTMTIHAEDMYNFNPGAHDIATGIPDAANGIFEVTGLATQYMNYGTLVRKITWNGTTPAGHAVEGAPGGRLRQPSDNRRLRNKV